jgi:hypothetical protein
MLSGTGYPSGENYPAGTGMELFFYPHAGTGNPTGKILRVRVRVRVDTTRRVCTRCHLELHPIRTRPVAILNCCLQCRILNHAWVSFILFICASVTDSHFNNCNGI